MVSREDDDLYRRVRRLEALIAVLIATDDFDYPDADFLLRRLLDDFDRIDQKDFSFQLRDMLRFRGGGKYPRRSSIFRRVDELFERTSELSKRIDQITSFNSKESLVSQVHELSRDVDRLTKEASAIRQETYENFVIDTMGLDHTKIAQTRYAPVRVYISEDSPKLVEVVEQAVKAYTEQLGFTPSTEYPPEKGSWFKKWIAKSKKALNSDEAEDAFKKGKRAIELTTLDKQRAEVNRENALAAGEFIKSIENVPNAVAQFGSLLIIKTKDKDGECSVMSRVLTEREMEFIESNQEIMKDAGNLLDKLSQVKIDRDTTIKLQSKNRR